MAKAEKTPPVTPYLTVRGGKAAIEFYKKAFGAKVGMLMMADDKQRVMHATLLLNGAAVMLSDVFDEFPQMTGGARPPLEVGGPSVTVHLEVPAVDQAWAKAMKAGAREVMPLADQFWGARYGQLSDPFGHVWSMASPIKAKAPAKAAAPKKAARKKAAKKKKR